MFICVCVYLCVCVCDIGWQRYAAEQALVWGLSSIVVCIATGSSVTPSGIGRQSEQE